MVVRNSQNNHPVSGAALNIYLEPDEGGKEVVARNVQVDASGKVSIELAEAGIYTLKLWAEGFISTTAHYAMGCTSAKCDHVKLVTLSPELPPGQTRIMMTWEKERPKDLDISVVSVRKSDKKTCRTFYGHKTGCPKISLDLDNTKGGPHGSETLTLLDNNVNKDYTYVIAVEDFSFENNGQSFLDSGCEIRITNGVKTKEKKMVAKSVTHGKSKE